jgi:hypothetical protein
LGQPALYRCRKAQARPGPYSPGEWLSWSRGIFVSLPEGDAFQFSLPPENVLNQIETLAQEYGIDLNAWY